MKNVIAKFKKETGKTLEIKNRKLYYGGSLYLRGTQITSLPDNLTVGGYLDLEGTQITNTSNINKEIPQIFQWRNFEYIKIDGIFSKVVSHHGNVYKIRQIGEFKERFVVTDGSGKWSHGDTIKEAKDDLIYKIPIAINQNINLLH